MVSGIRFFASSGAFGNTIASLYAAGRAEPGCEIFAFEISATDSPNRLGFFGLGGAPNSPVIVGQYQDRSHRTDHHGNNLGHLVNLKFTGSTTAAMSGDPVTDLQVVPAESGTLLMRFREPNANVVITQNGVFRAINLTAGSGAPDVTESALATNITVQAFQHPDTDGFAGDSAWTEISNGGTSLTLETQITEMHTHDFHVSVSASAAVAGRKRDFAFYVELEFL